MNVLAAEMEASIIFVLSHVWGLRAGGMAVVVDNVLENLVDVEEFDPETHFEHTEENIKKLAMMGNETVRILWEKDSK